MPLEVVEVRPHEKFEGVYWVKFEDGSERLATKNLVPGTRVYGEQVITWEGEEYRIWNPYRSKLAAAILKGLKEMPIKRGTKVLYLGAASGTTVSHISDIVGWEGVIYAVEFSPRVFREFLEKITGQGRKNCVAILGDARFPWQYRSLVETVDVVYIDVAQPFQAKILADNADFFLKKGGHVMQAIKAMSIDVTREPTETYKQEKQHLEERGYKIVDEVHLEPYDVAHAFIVGVKEKEL